MIDLDPTDVQRLKENLDLFKTKYGLSPSDVLTVFDSKDLLPLSIFSSKLSSTESVVKFLRQNKKLKFPEIAKLLNNNSASCWITYRNAIKKDSKEFSPMPSKYDIPFDKISSPTLSLLEHLSSYLKNTYNLSLHEIAGLLHRDERTIWTVCNRAKIKQKNKIKE